MRRTPPLLIALLLASLSPAGARADEPPTPANSIIPSYVIVVGSGPAGPDSATGHVTVTFRDLANNPVPGALVEFDFSACTDVALAADQQDPRLTVDCGRRVVSAVTDQAGIASFTIVGRGIPGPQSPTTGLRIYADGIQLGSIPVAVLERDGANGLTLADLQFWFMDFVSSTNPPRADYNGVGGVNLVDLSIWASAYFSGNDSQPPASICP